MENTMLLYFVIYFILINIISYFTMWYDKRLAKSQSYRISEKALFILALALGAIGIYSGMYKFRHKTKHLKFTIGIPVVVILNIITIYYLLTKVILV